MKKIILSVLCSFVLMGSMAFAAPREQQLKVYNWADYIDEDLIEEFEQWYFEQTGEKVEIIYQIFDINEVMLSKIEKGHEDFDVVCPSDYIIERMLRADLLLPVSCDFGTTPDYTGNIAPFMMDMLSNVEGYGHNPADYAVPYMWGTVGIMYNPKYVSAEEVRDWDVLKDPRFPGKVLVKEAFRDVYSTFNIALHKDEIMSGALTVEDLTRSVTPESIAAVEAYLGEMQDNIGGWEADFGKEMMTKEKYWLNMTWSGDAAWAMDEAAAVGVELDYAIPDGGTLVWFDAWVIPKYAKNVKAAQYFINYMCMPENAVRNMDYIGYVSAVGGDYVLESMSDEEFEPLDASYFFGPEATAVCLNPVLYPDASRVEFSGMMHDVGTEELLAMWSRVKGDNANALTIAIAVGLFIGAAAAFFLNSRKKKRGHRR